MGVLTCGFASCSDGHGQNLTRFNLPMGDLFIFWIHCIVDVAKF